ncbi:MAG: protein phosphatase CheZ [Dissulfurimicrobium sp.]|uniref:protein phosphatase CheZ n=1 Tax=Dissulfurimicrobium TaxID=1769732 RepID=UPI001EDC4A23|nr:protein phosphatase CheZ [Dissulfurimicrobium hydrothermale]UKL12975.1 protein phosphatase CheZ [Dissulfurimicrobium hydrothermale]
MSLSYERELQAILRSTQAILNGEVDHEIRLDAEGIIGNIASAINKLIKNLKEAKPSFERVEKETPQFAVTTKTVANLMGDSTGKVLDICDNIIKECDIIMGSGALQQLPEIYEHHKKIKAEVFEIISVQSYQDVARQQLERMEKQLEEMRDTLIKALIILNIKKSPQRQVADECKEIINQIKAGSDAGRLVTQDLVDELLAEYGL